VGPEKVWSYEIGAKSEWLDRRLRLNATAFFQDTKDFQAGTAFVNPATGALSFVTRNLADLENKGLELELIAKPIAALTLTLAAGIQDIKFKIDSDRAPVDQFGFLSPAAQLAECRAALAGQPSPLGNAGTVVARAQGSCSGVITNRGELAEPVRAPDLTVSFGASYDVPIAGIGAVLTPGFNLQYTGNQEVGTNNLSGYVSAGGVANFAGDGEFLLGSFSEAHTVINANLTLRSDADVWSVSLSCDNCSDETYEQSTLSNFSYLNQPRTWGLKARWNF
jgi:iron complex outermembrane recepter protein